MGRHTANVEEEIRSGGWSAEKRKWLEQLQTYQSRSKLSFSLQVHFPFLWTSPVGQCWSLSCLYPISLKKWISSFGSMSAAARLWTGASPHLCSIGNKLRINESASTRGGDVMESRRREENSHTHLIVEPALRVKVFEVFHVSFGSPKVQVGDLEVTPNCHVKH
jgi:hypothetical protein